MAGSFQKKSKPLELPYPHRETFHPELFCNHCKKLLRQPYYLRPCSHNICLACLDPTIRYFIELKQGKKCPECKSEVESAHPAPGLEYRTGLIRSIEVAYINTRKLKQEDAQYTKKGDLSSRKLLGIYEDKVKGLGKTKIGPKNKMRVPKASEYETMLAEYTFVYESL